MGFKSISNLEMDKNEFVELFILVINKDKLIQKFGSSIDNNWNLLIEFEQIGMIKQKSFNKVTFSIEQYNDVFVVKSNAKNIDIIYQYLRKLKIC